MCSCDISTRLSCCIFGGWSYFCVEDGNDVYLSTEECVTLHSIGNAEHLQELCFVTHAPLQDQHFPQTFISTSFPNLRRLAVKNVSEDCMNVSLIALSNLNGLRDIEFMHVMLRYSPTDLSAGLFPKVNRLVLELCQFAHMAVPGDEEAKILDYPTELLSMPNSFPALKSVGE